MVAQSAFWETALETIARPPLALQFRIGARWLRSQTVFHSFLGAKYFRNRRNKNLYIWRKGRKLQIN